MVFCISYPQDVKLLYSPSGELHISKNGWEIDSSARLKALGKFLYAHFYIFREDKCLSGYTSEILRSYLQSEEQTICFLCLSSWINFHLADLKMKPSHEIKQPSSDSTDRTGPSGSLFSDNDFGPLPFCRRHQIGIASKSGKWWLPWKLTLLKICTVSMLEESWHDLLISLCF